MNGGTRALHLGVAIDGMGQHPAAWRRARADAATLVTAEPYVRHAQLAEQGRLDFVTLDDAFDLASDRPGRVRSRLDALLTLARAAPLTTGVGLVPTLDINHAEPFHTSKNVATLDWVSTGRAGWRPAVARADAEYAHFGRRRPAVRTSRYDEAGEVVDVVARLWDSWEDDAIIRDRATGRFVDRDKLHYIDFEGTHFRVRGPSITPRPPQGQPLVAADATDESSRHFAARWADLVLIDAPDADAAGRSADDLRARASAAGRPRDRLFVLANLELLLAATDGEAEAELARLEALDSWPTTPGRLRLVGGVGTVVETLWAWHGAGTVDGFVVLPARLPDDLVGFVDGVVPDLQRAGLFRRAYEGTTLRDRFGLPRPANRYVGTP